MSLVCVWMCLCILTDRNDKALWRRAMDNVHGVCVWRLLICVRSKKWTYHLELGVNVLLMLMLVSLCTALLRFALLCCAPCAAARCPNSNISTDVIASGSVWSTIGCFIYNSACTLTELLRCPGRVLVHSNFRNIDAWQCACAQHGILYIHTGKCCVQH